MGEPVNITTFSKSKSTNLRRDRQSLFACEPLLERYRAIRRQTEILCEPLQSDDFNLQAKTDSSPPKWHLAHTAWFFETFVLKIFVANYKTYHPQFASLFNSYYNGLEDMPHPRAQRGLLSRPTTREVFNYRCTVDEHILELLQLEHARKNEIIAAIELGLHHEQQHQELLLTDIKYAFSLNPLLPRYCAHPLQVLKTRSSIQSDWVEFPEQIADIGADALSFYFDNERPRHRQFLHAYALADSLVTNREYLEFIEDGGYSRPDWWLADGWAQCVQQQWQAPLYWHREGNNWRVFTLHGDVALDRDEPVCHISYYEADAYARWVGARLPTEYEWENAAHAQCVEGHFVEDGVLHPRAACASQQGLRQLFGDVWEWTGSAYAPYPGYIPPAGAVGEYNGKFMCNQMVLRGGSCVSPRDHLRASYRNFFYPADRWQFAGIRLAQSLI